MPGGKGTPTATAAEAARIVEEVACAPTPTATAAEAARVVEEVACAPAGGGARPGRRCGGAGLPRWGRPCQAAAAEGRRAVASYASVGRGREIERRGRRGTVERRNLENEKRKIEYIFACVDSDVEPKKLEKPTKAREEVREKKPLLAI